MIPSFRDNGVMVSYGRLLVPEEPCFFAAEALLWPGEPFENRFGANRKSGVGKDPIPDVKRPFKAPALCQPRGINDEESGSPSILIPLSVDVGFSACRISMTFVVV